MKYVIMSFIALSFAVSTVQAQARPRKTKKPKKQIGTHKNIDVPAGTVVLGKKN